MNQVEALFVPREVVADLLSSDPALVGASLGLLAARHEAAEDRFAALVDRSAEQRLAGFLLKAAERWGVPERGATRIGVRMTQAEMAMVIGARRETVALTLTTWKRAGLVALDHRQVLILARQELETRAGP
jgi:CRP-like cAMP-binding protein